MAYQDNQAMANALKLNTMMIEKYEELRNMDINLILLTLLRDSKNLSPQLRQKLKKEYGSDTYQRLETLGDAVLELVVKDALFDIYKLKEGDMTHLASKIVRNVSLYCLALHKGLCKLIYPYHSGEFKDCADIFEALIGAIYLHLQTTTTNPIEFITRWLDEEFKIHHFVNYLMTHPDEMDVCKALDNVQLSPQPSPIVSPTRSPNLPRTGKSSPVIKEDPFEPIPLETIKNMTDVELADTVGNLSRMIHMQETALAPEETQELKSKISTIQQQLRTIRNPIEKNSLSDSLKTLQRQLASQNIYKKDEQLQTNLKNLQREQASRVVLPYKSQLQNLYNKNKLNLVNYVFLGSRPFKIGISCPQGMTCGQQFIGLAIGQTKNAAEERAAKQALEFLEKRIDKNHSKEIEMAAHG